jgi:hypothetical protein
MLRSDGSSSRAQAAAVAPSAQLRTASRSTPQSPKHTTTSTTPTCEHLTRHNFPEKSAPALHERLGAQTQTHLRSIALADMPLPHGLRIVHKTATTFLVALSLPCLTCARCARAAATSCHKLVVAIIVVFLELVAILTRARNPCGTTPAVRGCPD